MGWFGGGKKDGGSDGGREPNGPGPRTATNAPRHWPVVNVDAWVPGHEAERYLAIAATLVALKASGGRLAFYQTRLYDDGVLVIPLLVTEEAQQTAVFAYPRADAKAAAHFSGVRALLRQREGINAVYYAPDAIQPAAPATVVQAIDTPHFHRVDKARPPAEYALWWPTPEDPTFATSPALAHLDRWFEALDGYFTIIFTSFVRELRLDKDADPAKPKLYALPAQSMMVPIEAPAALPVYLHGSAGQGVWIAIDTTTPVAQRNRLLKVLADFASGFRAAAQAQGVSPDANGDRGRVLEWWQGVRADAIEKERAGIPGDVDLRIVRIAEDETARRLQAYATTRAERQQAATTAAPSAPLVDFARGLLDHAVGIAGRAMEWWPEEKMPGPGESAQPSIPPMLCIRAGGATWTVLCWEDDQPAASAWLDDLIAEHVAEHGPEHGGVEMVGIANDILIRGEGESKVDALYVRVQARGDDRCHAFVQRYTPRRRGQAFETRGNWALLGREAALAALHDGASSAAVDRPSERAMTRAKESIASLVSTMVLKEGSALANRAHSNLFSPRMQLEFADKPGILVMFGMMGAAEGRLAARKAVKKEPGVVRASFEYDHVRLKNGEPARELRVVVHEPGARAFLFAQAYEAPVAGQPLRTIGDLRLIGPTSPIFTD